MAAVSCLGFMGLTSGGVGGFRVSGLWGLKALQGLGHTRVVRALKPQTAKNLGGPLKRSH